LLLQVTCAVGIGAVGYFVDETGNTLGGTGLSRQLLVDLGMYGRHEFFLSAAAIGIFAAILSLVVAIANIQEKTHWAVNVSCYSRYFCTMKSTKKLTLLNLN
jgi:hypothetical protein